MVIYETTQLLFDQRAQLLYVAHQRVSSSNSGGSQLQHEWNYNNILRSFWFFFLTWIIIFLAGKHVRVNSFRLMLLIFKAVHTLAKTQFSLHHGFRRKYNKIIENTHLVPKLRHLRWPGTNLLAADAACNRSDPAHPRAGESDSAATPVTTSPTDSLLLLDDATGEFGSSFIDSLWKKKLFMNVFFLWRRSEGCAYTLKLLCIICELIKGLGIIAMRSESLKIETSSSCSS